MIEYLYSYSSRRSGHSRMIVALFYCLGRSIIYRHSSAPRLLDHPLVRPCIDLVSVDSGL